MAGVLVTSYYFFPNVRATCIRLLPFAVLGVLVVAALAIVGVLRLEPRLDRRGVIAQGIFRSNYVIMGIPIAHLHFYKSHKRSEFILEDSKNPHKHWIYEGFGGECWTRTSDLLRVKQAL